MGVESVPGAPIAIPLLLPDVFGFVEWKLQDVSDASGWGSRLNAKNIGRIYVLTARVATCRHAEEMQTRVKGWVADRAGRPVLKFEC